MNYGKSSLNNLIFTGLICLLVSCSHTKQGQQADSQVESNSNSKKSAPKNAAKGGKNGTGNQFNNNWSNMGENPPKNANSDKISDKKKDTKNKENSDENGLEQEAANGADTNNDTSPDNLGQEQLANVQNVPANSQVPLNQAPLNQVPENIQTLQAAPLNNAVPINGLNASAPTPSQPAIMAPIATVPDADVLPKLAELRWIGYSFVEADRVLKIELVTNGKPDFDVFQESNKLGQPELVIRFKQTSLRRKLKRDIDASEFRSPVAFIRTRFDGATGNTDVVLTLRDEVQPKMYAKDGSILLTYSVPSRYFGPNGSAAVPVTTAQILPTANVSPVIDPGSDMPGTKVAAYVPDPAKAAFADAPANGGVPIEQVEQPVEAVQELVPDSNGLPENFMNEGPQQASAIPQTDNFNMDNPVPEAKNPAANGLNFGGGNSGLNNKNGLNATGTVDADDSSQGSESDSEFEPNNDFDNFDDGEGESKDSNEKFEVRIKDNSPIIVSTFGAFTVAQDNGDDAEFDGDEGTGNEGNGNVVSNSQGASNNAPVNNFNGTNSANGPVNNSLSNAAVNNAGGGNVPLSNSNGAAANGMFTNNAAANPSLDSGPLVSNPAPVDLSNTGLPSDSSVLTNAAAPEPDLVGADVGTPGIQNTAATAPPADDGSVMGVNKKVNLDFRGAPLGEVIRVLSDESGINFLYEPTIGNRQVYVRLKDVTIETALNGILETYGLGMVTLGPKLIRIDTLAAITLDRQNLQNARQTAARLAPTKIMIMRLNYLTADRGVALAQGLLQGGGVGPAAPAAAAVNSGPDPRIRITSEVRTNSMIIEATEADLGRVKTMIERLDIPTPQIKIASKLVAVRKSNTHEIGVSWTNGELNYDQRAGLGFGNLTFPNSMQANYAVDPGRVQGNGSFGFRFGSINNVLRLDMLLQMAETRGVVETLQNSEVIVEDNIQAAVTSGVTDVFPVQGVAAGGGVGGTTLSQIQYNTAVTVTPRVTNDGKIQMTLNVTNNEPTPPSASSTGASAGILNRQVTTTMMRRSGETAVIAGTFADNKTKTQRGIPWLSWMPIIGALFRNTVTQDSQTENVFLITPTILSGSSDGGGGGGFSPPVASNYSGGSTGQSNSNNQSNNAQNGNNSLNNGSQNSQNNSNSENAGNSENMGNGSQQNSNQSQNNDSI